ncbi:MAG: rod shape-determining protein MreC, partial [Candidatus Paceibacterota bacterium]
SFHFFSSAANDGAMPVWKMGSAGKSFFSKCGLFLNSQKALVAKNGELSEKIKKLELRLTGYDFVVQENLELKKTLFHRKENTVFGAVVARPNVSAYDTFLLDIGENFGIKKGDKILANENMILGFVEEAYPVSAKARLFSTAGEVTDAILGPDNIPVQLKGSGGGSFILELPREMDVEEGDSAILPGVPEYIIATVISKEEVSTESFQKIYLRGPVSVFDVKYVQIIKNTSF